MNKAWFILLFLAAVSCGPGAVKDSGGIVDKVETEGGEEVYSFSKEDSAMNAAIGEAKRTYSQFETVVFSGDTSLTDFALKMAFVRDQDIEHMWMSELHRKNGKLYGVLDSDPYYFEDMELGDTILIEKEKVSDWVYGKKGKMVGGYTLRVMYNSFSEEEKKEFKASLPYEIE